MTMATTPSRGSTADPAAARAHARAQEGSVARSMRTVPAAAATGLPAGVSNEDVVWDETLDGWRYAARSLARGTRLRLTDLDGEGCVQLLAFNALAPDERLNVADTAKVQWQAYLGTGSVLLTDMGRVIATVVDDGAAGHHDLFCGASAGGDRSVGDATPPARRLLELGAARVGLGRRDLHPCINLFKGVRVVDGDSLTFTGGGGPGATVELRFELPVHVVVANTPHVLDTRTDPPCTAVRLTAWRAAPTGPDDPWRSTTPERRRAFENTDELLLGHPFVEGGWR